MNKKELVVKYRPLIALACSVYNLKNIFRRKTAKGTQITTSCTMLDKVNFQIKVQNNVGIIEDFCRLKNCSIIISGNNNRIVIGNGLCIVCYCRNDKFVCYFVLI